MATLSVPELFEREFGGSLLHVGTFSDWLKKKGLHIDAGPLLSSSEFVQVEALLCAVGGAAVADQDLEHLSAIVANDKALRAKFVAQGHSEETKAMLAGKLAIYDGRKEKILMGANHVISTAAHSRWRELISQAVENRELALLDYASKLPVTKTADNAINTAMEIAAEVRPAANWKMRIQEEAAARWRRLRANGANPTKNSIKDDLSKWCRDKNILTSTGITPNAEYIARHVLKDWTPPKD